MELHYAGSISAVLFAEEEAALTGRIQSLRDLSEPEPEPSDDLAARFEQVVDLLASLDLDRLWQAATDPERRTLIEELLDTLEVHPDRLTVAIHGAPRLNVSLAEVGWATASRQLLVSEDRRHPSCLPLASTARGDWLASLHNGGSRIASLDRPV